MLARKLSDGIVDTGFRPSDDHRAAAVLHDVDRNLPSHASTAADHNDLLGLKVHIGAPFLVFLDGSGWTAASPRRVGRQSQLGSGP
jgi:hypothetical protein